MICTREPDGGVEEDVSASTSPRRLRLLPRYVPDETSLASLTARDVELALARSGRRLGRRPHAVQLHWWGEADEALARCAALLARSAGVYFRALGVTNMDVRHLRVLREHVDVSLCQAREAAARARSGQGFRQGFDDLWA